MIGYWIALAAAIATSMGGQALLKAGAGAPDFLAQVLDRRTLAGFGLYAGAALLYIVALRRIPMSVALPSTAVSYVAAALIGHFAFDEPLTSLHLTAIFLIATGVLVLAVASS
jgi:multidrug transporter EmrE-like cation transporter